MIKKNYNIQQDDYMETKCVNGFLENEIQIQQGNDRQCYTNSEINECLSNYFRFFGNKDMDLIYLYFLSNKKQEQIMKILNKSQPAVSYDVTRIKKQLNFIVQFVSCIDDFILFITDPENKMKTFDKEMLTIFLYSTSIIKTSKLLGINNITCRSHLNTIIKKLLVNGHKDIYNLFKYVLSNLNNIKKQV